MISSGMRMDAHRSIEYRSHRVVAIGAWGKGVPAAWITRQLITRASCAFNEEPAMTDERRTLDTSKSSITDNQSLRTIE